MVRTFISFLMVLISTSVLGARILEVEIAGQPNMIMSPDGSIGLCGMRFLLANKTIEEKEGIANLIDASLNMNAQGGVLIKGLGLTVTNKKTGGKNITRLPLKAIWIKSQGGTATIPGVQLESEDKIAIMYVDKVLIERYSELFKSISENKPIMIGVTMASGVEDTIFTGSVKLTEVERDAFLNCSLELIESIIAKMQK